MDLTTIVVNVASAVVEFQSLAGIAAFGIGLYYVYLAISHAIKASKAPGGGDVTAGAIFGPLLIGSLLLDFGSSMGGVFNSMSGEDGRSYGMVAYPGASVAGKFEPAINAALTIASTFGWWYGLKGWLMWKKASEGGGNGYNDFTWKGFIHILGGAALINIVSTIQAFQATTGIAF